jgi:uncharacterized Zn finger protein
MMGIVPNPFRPLACITCTQERISDSITLAQVGVISASWASVRVSRTQVGKSESCKRRVSKNCTYMVGTNTHSRHYMLPLDMLRPRMDFG